jgi:hypothetical protein
MALCVSSVFYPGVPGKNTGTTLRHRVEGFAGRLILI